MSLMDGILLTVVNTVACLVLPKLLSTVLMAKPQSKTPKIPVMRSPESTPAITSYADVVS
ncbi:hypothetical protein [Nostoc sp. TCL26-01]|uniref:hypothetical protein n=1 Tax=Nostoc sp. TCL26-01 TaxID=2576904 RepID=UPI0015B9B54B|nr:hypothetical protein [Nostoc sp. TCL26-01]QLE57258.1 hypothetical protein FD725_18055 [Nostoc sp. TCL26-01]